MRAIHEATAGLLRETLIGAWLGLWLLGVGGRIAMRVVAVALGQPPILDPEGTLTVVAAGTAAGVAGALLHAVSRGVAGALADVLLGDHAAGPRWTRLLRLTTFAALLGLVTARGLSGSAGPTWMFWLLVALYGVAFELALQRRARKASRVASVLIAGGLLLAITACAEQRGRAHGDSSRARAESRDPEALFRAQLGRTWELVRLGAQDIPANRSATSTRDPRRHPGPGSRPTIRFTADRAEQAPDSGMSSAGGWSFCNGYGAAYRAGPGDALRFHQFHSTLVGCDGPDSLESRYFRALGNTRHFAFDSTTLRLVADDGSSLVFEPSADSAGQASR